MNFGQALEALKQGKKVARTGWNGKGMWLRLVNPAETEANYVYENLPYIEMKTADFKLVPWLASQIDMLAEDWKIAEYQQVYTSPAATGTAAAHSESSQSVSVQPKISVYIGNREIEDFVIETVTNENANSGGWSV